MSAKDCVTLKGTAGGVNMLLDADSSINEILDCLREKIKSAKGFFKGECDVFVFGRDMSKADKLRITSVMNTVFPEANIVFRQEVMAEPPEIISKNHTDKGEKFMQELIKTAEASKGALKSRKGVLKPHKYDVKLFTGSIASGEHITIAGDLLVVGNVDKGAQVEATGSVYIMGRLSGKVVCGSSMDLSSHVVATAFLPESVSLCGVNIEFDENAQESLPKMAYLLKDEICIEEIL